MMQHTITCKRICARELLLDLHFADSCFVMSCSLDSSSWKHVRMIATLGVLKTAVTVVAAEMPCKNNMLSRVFLYIE